MNKAKMKFTPTKDMIEAAETVFKAMAYVETLKPVVTGYQEAVLKKHQFEAEGDIVLNPDHCYLLKDTDFEIYLKEINEARVKAGLKISKEGNCPLLEAETILRDAQRVLVDTMEPVTNLDTDTVLCSKNGMENYKQLIDMILKLLSSFVKKSL
jgi:hypothetical protein